MSKYMCKKFLKGAFDAPTTSPHQQNVQSACYQLRSTSPKFIEGWTWSSASLLGSNWAFLWLVANELLGSKWSIKDTVQLPAKPLPTMATSLLPKTWSFKVKQQEVVYIWSLRNVPAQQRNLFPSTGLLAWIPKIW